MRAYSFFVLLFVAFNVSAQEKGDQTTSGNSEIYVVNENKKAFLKNDLDRYVVYDLMSDGSMVFKDTLDFNEYRDKAIFTITQNQTIINYQLWATISLLIVSVGLLIFLILRK